jgi:glycosyltransferase involved in cell wall biosynthesis
MTPPRITVVIPAHNAGRYLAEAIASVQRQTCPATELIVINDGSTDDTTQVAGSFGDDLLCVSQPHQGAAAARNLGVEMAKGDYIAFLDADDIWSPAKVERQMEALDDPHPPDIVFGWIDQFLSPELGKLGDLPTSPTPLQPGLCATTALAPAATWRSVGPFDTTLTIGEFIDWMARAMSLGLTYATVDAHVASRRIHRHNHTRLNYESMSDLTHVLKAHLTRGRQGNQK